MSDDYNNKKDYEDKSKYGEFISTFFNWKTLEEQKEVVEKIEKITKKENKWEKRRIEEKIKESQRRSKNIGRK